jgi:hypothetical protein
VDKDILVALISAGATIVTGVLGFLRTRSPVDSHKATGVGGPFGQPSLAPRRHRSFLVISLVVLLALAAGTGAALASSLLISEPNTHPTTPPTSEPTEPTKRPPTPSPAEITLHGVPIGGYQATFNRVTGRGYRPVWIDGYEVGADVYMNVIFRRADGVPWAARHNLTAAGYQSEFDTLSAQGYRLINVTSYLDGGVRYAAVWRKETGSALVAYHGLNAQDHQTRFNSLTSQGYHPVNISIVSPNDQTQFTAFYVKENVGSFVADSFLTPDQYQQEWNSNAAAGRQLTYLSACQHAGGLRFSAIFQEVAPGSGGVYGRHNLTAAPFQTELDTQFGKGYLTRVVAGYTLGGVAMFAGAWRKP